MMRSARVVLPWSMWAMMEKLRMSSGWGRHGGSGCSRDRGLARGCQRDSEAQRPQKIGPRSPGWTILVGCPMVNSAKSRDVRLLPPLIGGARLATMENSAGRRWRRCALMVSSLALLALRRQKQRWQHDRCRHRCKATRSLCRGSTHRFATPRVRRSSTFDLQSRQRARRLEALRDRRRRWHRARGPHLQANRPRHDGTKEYVATYSRTGEILAEEFDFDFDGRFDARAHYDKKTGKISSSSAIPTTTTSPTSGRRTILKVVSSRFAATATPTASRIIGSSIKDGTLVAILYDDDFDNRVDRKDSRWRHRRKTRRTRQSAAAPRRRPASGRIPRRIDRRRCGWQPRATRLATEG